MEPTKVFIVASGNQMSGGPELLHQLGDLLNRDGRRAWMLYLPLGDAFDVPDPYRRYDIAPAALADVSPGSIVVLPEVCAPLVDQFPGCQVYFWWLSVDNFFTVARHQPLGVLRSRRTTGRQFRAMRNAGVYHLFQSEYARQLCEAQSLSPAARLGDYLAEEYLAAAARPRGAREDLVVYNPAKGKRRTQAILKSLDVPAVPIQGMSRAEILELLSRAKVYIDFGGHPGKDRIPREAVAAGCCVVTNRRGSAGNGIDIPIPDEFKVDDQRRGYPRAAADTIRRLLDDFDTHATKFDAYRDGIASERHGFLADVKMIFG